jgi:regulatory protein
MYLKMSEQAKEAKEVKKAKKRLARLVARRYYSEKELRDKLNQFSEEEIEEAISWAKEQRFIDDERFSRAFIHDALLFKPQGRRLILVSLSKKGIDDSLSEFVLNEEYPEELEVELAEKVAQKYANTMREQDDKKRFTKLCGYLLRRGFPDHLVYDVAKNTLNLDNLI